MEKKIFIIIKGISLLMEYAGLKSVGKGKKSEDNIEPTTEFNKIVIEAMKCLANALLQNRQSQEFFDNNNGIKSLLVNLKVRYKKYILP